MQALQQGGTRLIIITISLKGNLPGGELRSLWEEILVLVGL